MGIVHTKIRGGSVKYDDTDAEKAYAMNTYRRDDTNVVKYKKTIDDKVDQTCVALELDP